MEDKKFSIGQVSILIIIVFAVFADLYKILELNVHVLNEIAKFVFDASFFLTMICVSFLIYGLFSENKKNSLVLECLAGIILVNRLYSNQKLKEIKKYFQNIIGKIDIRIVLLGAVLVPITVYFLYRINKSKKAANEKIKSQESNGLGENSEKSYHNNIDILGDYRKKGVTVRENKENDSDENESKDFIKKSRKGILIVCAVCVIIIAWGILDYLIFEKYQLGISRPQQLQWFPKILYWISIFCGAILIGVVVLQIIMRIRNYNVFDLSGGSFRVSAIIAAALEIIFLVKYERISEGKLTDRFMSAVTGNTFSSLFAFIIIFIVLQIGCMIFIHIFVGENQGNSKNDVIVEIKNRIENIEFQIVHMAFNIIMGCLALFDFIPDFFTTIGAILLDKEITIGQSTNEDNTK